MSWVAIGAAAVTVVGGAINANQAKKGAAKVATYQPVDYTSVQSDAIAGNLSNSSGIEALLSRGNAFNADQALSIQNQTMPGYSALAKSLTSRAQGLADNPYDVPKEVEDNLARLAAERGISAGTRGQFNDFSLLRDFGVNQLQYGRENLNQAQSITGLLATIAPKVNPMSPMSFYVTPAQREATVTNNNAQSQAIAQGAINAQNAATNAGNANMLASLTQIAGMYAGSKSGSTSTNADPSGGVMAGASAINFDSRG